MLLNKYLCVCVCVFVHVCDVKNIFVGCSLTSQHIFDKIQSCQDEVCFFFNFFLNLHFFFCDFILKLFVSLKDTVFV